VHEQVRSKVDAGFVDLGDQTVKNIPGQVRVYRVGPPGESSAKPPTGAPWRAAWIGAVAVAMALVAAALWWTNRGDAPSEPVAVLGAEATDPIAELPSGPTVAVLPSPEQEYFSDGLAEDIITKLSQFKDLFVIARNSTFQYKGRAVDVRDVARELGARYVLEGSVRRAGTSLRVTAQLLDAGDGTHLWADTYDRDLSASSIFDVQDEITEHVVASIAGFGTPAGSE
jgi:adenylate cyclase